MQNPMTLKLNIFWNIDITWMLCWISSFSKKPQKNRLNFLKRSIDNIVFWIFLFWLRCCRRMQTFLDIQIELTNNRHKPLHHSNTTKNVWMLQKNWCDHHRLGVKTKYTMQSVNLITITTKNPMSSQLSLNAILLITAILLIPQIDQPPNPCKWEISEAYWIF